MKDEVFSIRWIAGNARADYFGNDLSLLVEGEGLNGGKVYLDIDAPSIRKLAELLNDSQDFLLSLSIPKEAARSVEVRTSDDGESVQWAA